MLKKLKNKLRVSSQSGKGKDRRKSRTRMDPY